MNKLLCMTVLLGGAAMAQTLLLAAPCDDMEPGVNTSVLVL